MVINPLLSLEDEKDDMNYLPRSLAPVVHSRFFSWKVRLARPSGEMACPFDVSAAGCVYRLVIRDDGLEPLADVCSVRKQNIVAHFSINFSRTTLLQKFLLGRLSFGLK